MVIFPFYQNLHSKETLNIYIVELPASHWDQALRGQWSSSFC